MGTNMVILQGRLLESPEMRHDDRGIDFVSVYILGDGGCADAEAEHMSFTMVPAMAIGDTARYICNHCLDGDNVTIVGHIGTAKYTMPDGDDRFGFVIRIDQIRICDPIGDDVPEWW